MNRGVGKQPQENPTGSRELISMNKPTEEGHMDPREVGTVHPAMPQRIIDQGTQISEEAQLDSNERPMQNANATGRCDSAIWSHADQGKNRVSDSNRRKNPEVQSEGNDFQAGHLRDATSMASAFEPLNRSLEAFLTRLCRTSERSEKSRRVFKKPRCYKDESDGFIDTWIEVMNLDETS